MNLGAADRRPQPLVTARPLQRPGPDNAVKAADSSVMPATVPRGTHVISGPPRGLSGPSGATMWMRRDLKGR